MLARLEAEVVNSPLSNDAVPDPSSRGNFAGNVRQEATELRRKLVQRRDRKVIISRFNRCSRYDGLRGMISAPSPRRKVAPIQRGISCLNSGARVHKTRPLFMLTYANRFAYKPGAEVPADFRSEPRRLSSRSSLLRGDLILKTTQPAIQPSRFRDAQFPLSRYCYRRPLPRINYTAGKSGAKGTGTRDNSAGSPGGGGARLHARFAGGLGPRERRGDGCYGGRRLHSLRGSLVVEFSGPCPGCLLSRVSLVAAISERR